MLLIDLVAEDAGCPDELVQRCWATSALACYYPGAALHHSALTVGVLCEAPVTVAVGVDEPREGIETRCIYDSIGITLELPRFHNPTLFDTDVSDVFLVYAIDDPGVPDNSIIISQINHIRICPADKNG